ncbi:MAG: hypothetical protein A2144_01505 [Chloroflexi bacterium RBG_16_50_9]|nr:MAG: hypothetical protein A2144_01505 [Chloroflexi bacterium RBG_16_50_9]
MIKLGNGLILLNLLDIILVIVILLLPSSVLRIVLVIPFLLFFPGYAMLVAVFPGKTEIGGVERVTLSVVLSAIIVALTGLILNFSPWGIRLAPVLNSIVLIVFITSMIAWFRQRKLTKDERIDINFYRPRPNWANLVKMKVFTLVLVTAIIGALGILVYFAVTPPAGETFTEFYILGQQGKSGDYPDHLKAGEEGRVRVGIKNHEKTNVNYSIKILAGNNLSAVIGPVSLLDEQTWEEEVGFLFTVAGEDQKVGFLLFKEGQVEPYKELHLWVDVTE